MAVVDEPNPTAARREVALAFRTLREQRGRGLPELARFLKVSEVQASRLDRGVRGMRLEDVRRLARWYELPDGERDRLLELAAESRRRSWWQQVDLGDETYRTLIGMEQAAESIGEYGNGVVPGLLQTPAYARAAVSGGALNASPDEVERAVEVRIRRQEILDREDPSRLWVVIDEAVLARVTGGSDVMRAQLEHLVAMADRPTITVQVLAFDYGAHPGGNSHFILVDTGGGLPDLVYVEGLRGRAEFTSKADTGRYREVWDVLRSIALSPRESREMLAHYAASYAADSRHPGEPVEEEQRR